MTSIVKLAEITHFFKFLAPKTSQNSAGIAANIYYVIKKKLIVKSVQNDSDLEPYMRNSELNYSFITLIKIAKFSSIVGSLAKNYRKLSDCNQCIVIDGVFSLCFCKNQKNLSNR